MNSNTYSGSEVKAMTVVRLLVLSVAMVNLVLSIFCDYRIPGLTQENQEQLAVLISLAASVAAYWYNNSWSAGATTSDKILQIIKNADVTADDMDVIVRGVQNAVDSIKYGNSSKVGDSDDGSNDQSP